MPVKQRTWQTLSERKLTKAVKIIVWRNNDFKTPGQEVTFHHKYLKSWNAALDFLTFALKPRFGAVRKLYHIDTKKPVLNLEDIKENDKYVAVGSEKAKFPKNGYFTEQEVNKVTDVISDAPQSVERVGSDLNFLEYTKKNRRTVVYFMVSGRSYQPPLKVVLIERDFLDDAILLEYLGYRLDVGEGILCICTIHGKIVPKFTDLKHGNLYIVVPHSGKFVYLDYTKLFAELFPSKTIELVQPTKQKNGHKKNCLRKRTSCQKNKKSGTLGSLEAKCIGVSCVDEDCRRSRDESVSVSQATSIEDIPIYDEVAIKAKDTIEKLECQLAANWDEYAANLRKTVTEVAGEVDMIKNTLDNILDRTIVEVEDRGIAAPSFITSDIADTDEDVSTETSPSLEKNLTTFAEIARQREWLQEAETIFAFDSLPRSNPPAPHGSDNRVSLGSSAKKSVSFGQCGRPEIIFESREAPSAIEPNKPTRTSILKVSKWDDSLKVLPKPDKEGPVAPVLKKSFMKLRDSVTEVTNALFWAEKPDKKGPVAPVLKESFMKLGDSVTEVTNALFSAEKSGKNGPVVPLLKESFLKLRDSVTEVTNSPSGFSAEQPDKKGPVGPVLKESFLKLRDNVTEVPNSLSGFSASEKPDKTCPIAPVLEESILKLRDNVTEVPNSLSGFSASEKPDKKCPIAPVPEESFLKLRDNVTEVPNSLSGFSAPEKPDKKCPVAPVLEESFLKLRDNVTEVTNALSGFSVEKPDKQGPLLKESFLKLQDSVSEVTNTLCSTEKHCVQERDSLEDIRNGSIFYPLEAKRSMSDLFFECHNHCKGVQKDWKQDEDIMNKGIQVQEPTNGYARLSSFAQLYDNVDEDDDVSVMLNLSTSNVDNTKPLKLSCVSAFSDGTRQSLKPSCRREDSNTFACSDICLYQCGAGEKCSEKC